MKRGRPKKIDKAVNRVHQVILDEVSENIFRKISNARGRTNWLHEYLSEHLKRDFLPNLQEGLLQQELITTQEARDKYEKRMAMIAYDLSALKKRKKQVEVNKLIQEAGTQAMSEGYYIGD